MPSCSISTRLRPGQAVAVPAFSKRVAPVCGASPTLRLRIGGRGSNGGSEKALMNGKVAVFAFAGWMASLLGSAFALDPTPLENRAQLDEEGREKPA